MTAFLAPHTFVRLFSAILPRVGAFTLPFGSSECEEGVSHVTPYPVLAWTYDRCADYAGVTRKSNA